MLLRFGDFGVFLFGFRDDGLQFLDAVVGGVDVIAPLLSLVDLLFVLGLRGLSFGDLRCDVVRGLQVGLTVVDDVVLLVKQPLLFFRICLSSL